MPRFFSLKVLVGFCLGWGCFLLISGTPQPVHASRSLAGFISPEVGKFLPTFSYRATFYLETPVLNQPTELKMLQHKGAVAFPVWQNSRQELSGVATLRAEVFQTDMVFPENGDLFPGDLWEIRFGPTYRRKFKNNWVAGGNLLFGSASDKPFSSLEVLELIFSGFFRLPHGKDNAFIFFLNYSNNREFLNNIPFPGFGYWIGKKNKWVRGLVGAPMSFKLFPEFPANLQVTWFPVRSVKAELAYAPLIFLKFYTYFEWLNERHFLSTRTDSDDRLFYYEKRIGTGVKIRPARFAELDISGGYLFDRFYFQGTGYNDRFNDRIDVANGGFVSVQLGLRFGGVHGVLKMKGIPEDYVPKYY